MCVRMNEHACVRVIIIRGGAAVVCAFTDVHVAHDYSSTSHASDSIHVLASLKRHTTVTPPLRHNACHYRSDAKIRPPFLGISASGKIGVGVILRKHNFLENRPTLQTDLENMLVFSSKEK